MWIGGAYASSLYCRYLIRIIPGRLDSSLLSTDHARVCDMALQVQGMLMGRCGTPSRRKRQQRSPMCNCSRLRQNAATRACISKLRYALRCAADTMRSTHAMWPLGIVAWGNFKTTTTTFDITTSQTASQIMLSLLILFAPFLSLFFFSLFPFPFSLFPLPFPHHHPSLVACMQHAL